MEEHKRKVNIKEYETLRDEMRDRIKMLNTQNLTMLAIVVSAWVLVATIIGVVVSDKVDAPLADYLLLLVAGFLFSVPTLIMIPLSVHNGDNLYQISYMAEYAKAYFEYPSKLHDGDFVFGWERTQNKNFGRGRLLFFCLEYPMVAVISSAVQFVYLTLLSCYIAEYQKYSIPFTVVLAILGIVSTIAISVYSSPKRNILNNKTRLLDMALDNAKQDGVLTEQEVSEIKSIEYKKFLKGEMKNMDKNIGQIRAVMCSGRFYDPIIWQYTEGSPFEQDAKVNYAAVMNKYKELCQKDVYSFNAAKTEAKRAKYLRKIFGIGDDRFCHIEAPLHANYGGKHTHLKGSFYANFNLTLIEDGEIEIGDKVMIGPNVTLCTAEHPKDIKQRAQGRGILRNKKITIGDNVWIGANAVILGGAEIGDNCIIGAGCIVTHDTKIPPNKIAVGVVSNNNADKLKTVDK